MTSRFYWFFATLLAIGLLVAACGGSEAPAPAPAEEEPAAEVEEAAEEEEEAAEEEPAAEEEAEEEAMEEEAMEEEAASDVMRFGQITDVGGIDDKGFNQLAWEGLQAAGASTGAEVNFLESQQQTDYEKNINEFIDQGYNGIVTVGFLLADATKAASEANPDVPFAIVDFPSQTSGDLGLLFAVSEPSFLAGYLSAGMSETGIVCTYGGIKIPPVVEFMVGFESGVNYYNSQKGADVSVLGWATDAATEGGGDGSFTGNFESLDDGRSFAENFFDEGCDIIFPVAGPVGLGSAAAAQDRGFSVIGVDADLTQTNPDAAEVYLTSVLKKIDVAVEAAVTQMADGSFEGGTNLISNLANNGVGLAPFYDFDVPQELQDELATIEAGIIDGSISTGWPIGAEAAVAAEEEAAPADSGLRFGQITDVGGIDDKGFNQLAWEGLQAAGASTGAEVNFLESQQQTDYEKNINEFLGQDYNGIVTVGFLLADATKAASEANPDVPFAIVDFPSQTSGDLGLLFAVSEPSFLAGYLAAGMSETGIVCTYGGIKIPPVVEFMVGFESGVNYHNSQKGTDVSVLGWSTDAAAEGGGDGSFTGNFESLDDGRSFAENFFDEGCDIIFPVAGPVGLGSAAAAQDRGFSVIGVDADLTQTNPDAAEVYLTSVLKKIDVAVNEAVTQMADGSFEGGTNLISNLANGGVGLAPFYDFDVPQELQDELSAIEAGIIDGSISTGWPVGAEPAPVEEDVQDEHAEESAIPEGLRFGQITDVGGIDDKGFNQLAWEGLQAAGANAGAEVNFLESQQQTDYEKNINEFLGQGYNGIVTVGFLLADATKAASEANPDVPFAIVDFPSQTSGDLGLLFAVDQPSFLAGYLAAGMSETGIVCTYGGIKIPPVVAFMVGFESGVNYYNSQKGADVSVLGWATDAATEGGGDGSFTGNFESLDDGRSFAENFFDEGCDIIFPVAGPVGLGSAAAAQDRGFSVIGVDADLTLTNPDAAEVYLTSVLKKIDVAVEAAVTQMADGSFEGGTNLLSTLENGGVGLAPFYDFDVPQELQDELSAIEAGIIDGSISTGWPVE